MRAVVQRVTEATVMVADDVVGEIGPGLMILVCAMAGDTDAQAAQLASKIAKLRIFRDEAGKMNRSLLETSGSALVVSQFTLAADTSRGNRTGFSSAAPAVEGERLYNLFSDHLREMGIAVANGKFGADMNEVVIGNGSNELLTLLVRAFCLPEHNAVISDYSFVAYRVVLTAAGIPIKSVPVQEGFQQDLPAMAAACDENTRIVFLANPNNPTGT